ncbi:PiggyBac transposable element-derived protein 3 [Trichinella sp. T8]|nr:PiggyBac transposable element-derived protein 3 [Trichinella sp. T8]
MTMATFESFLRMLDGGNAVDEETKILLFIYQCPPAHPSDTSYLSECGVRLNRTVGVSEFLTSNKELMKLRRGSFDYACDGKVHIVKLHDNAVANNWQTYSPLHTVKIAGGMSTKGGMGGVDLLDSLLAVYRPTIRGKKWYWPLFANAINVATVAAWGIHCKVEQRPLSHLEFQRQVTMFAASRNA